MRSRRSASGPDVGSAWSSQTVTRQPSSGGAPGDGDVAAEVDHDPAAERLADPPCGAVSGQRLGGRAEVELDAGRDSNASWLGDRGSRSASRGSGAARPAARPSAASSSKSRSYPRFRIARPTVGSTAPSVARATRSATSIASISRSPTSTASPAASLTRMSSESSRNRLQARSIRSSSASSSSRAPTIAPGSVTKTDAVVPSALQRDEVIILRSRRRRWGPAAGAGTGAGAGGAAGGEREGEEAVLGVPPPPLLHVCLSGPGGAGAASRLRSRLSCLLFVECPGFAWATKPASAPTRATAPTQAHFVRLDARRNAASRAVPPRGREISRESIALQSGG